MVWDLENREVGGVNVTARYAKAGDGRAAVATVYLRLWEKEGGARLAAEVELLDSTGKAVNLRQGGH